MAVAGPTMSQPAPMLPPVPHGPFTGTGSFQAFQASQQHPWWPQQQQQQQQHQKQPRNKQRQGNKSKRGGGKRKRGQQLAAFDNLNKLERQNAKRTKSYYGGQAQTRPLPGTPASLSAGPTPGTTPQMPGAPANSTAFLMAQAAGEQGHAQSTSIAQSPSVTGLDLFGTNEGLITRRDSPASWSDEEASGATDGGSDSEPEEVHGYELHLDDAETQKILPRHIVARLQEQAAYIVQIEEENLNLRERLYILQQQLEDAQAAADAAGEDEPSELAGPSPTASHQEHIMQDTEEEQQQQSSREAQSS